MPIIDTLNINGVSYKLTCSLLKQASQSNGGGSSQNFIGGNIYQDSNLESAYIKGVLSEALGSSQVANGSIIYVVIYSTGKQNTKMAGYVTFIKIPEGFFCTEAVYSKASSWSAIINNGGWDIHSYVLQPSS